MPLHPSVVARLARLTPDQRAAATAPPGPVLCLAPAGSGKTTTLIARIAWLVGGGTPGGTPAGTIAAIAFNKRAADELAGRLSGALAPLGVAPGEVRVRTFHALGREILRSAGRSVEPLVDRDALLRRTLPGVDAAGRRRLDAAISRLKLDLRVSACEVAADAEAGPIARGFVAYERALAATGGLDFDDLVAGALTALEADPVLLARWRPACAQLLVDEVQDVDRSQLELALLLAAPANRIFLVGDDDQSIYGWRLADVRRVLDLDARLPGLRRHDLVTNFRCPAPVVERAVRLVEGNRERFAKRIVARDGAAGRLVLAPDAGDDDDRARRVMASWPPDAEADPSAGGTRAILARTNRELLPAAAVALELGIPFRAERLRLLVEDPRLDGLLEALAGAHGANQPLLVRIGALRRSLAAAAATPAGATEPDLGPQPIDPADPLDPAESELPLAELLGALLAWAAPFPDVPTFTAAVRARRDALAILRRADARLTLATAHGTKGSEFDHVAVVDMDADRFPSRRALDDADDPERALEEERRLAYVAWTRARRSLTLVYDPAAPSAFLREAFHPAELEPPP
jgi:superfamily I DNA/RNA helicase